MNTFVTYKSFLGGTPVLMTTSGIYHMIWIIDANTFLSGETTAGLTPYLLEPEGLTPYPLEEDTSGLQPYLLHGLQPVLLSTLMETTTTPEPAPTLPPYNPAPSPPPFCKYCKCRTATASSTPPSFSGIYVVYLFCYNRTGLRM